MMHRAWLFCLLLSSTLAQATDGVIEINHAKVMAAGGYPYQITASGSYRLTSNLSQPDANTDVVVIRVSNVSLDLNGFAIAGNNSCTQNGATLAVTCTASGSGYGVYLGDATLRNVEVRNGAVAKIGAGCISLASTNTLLQNLRVSECGGGGIITLSGGGRGLVRDSMVVLAALNGIAAFQVERGQATSCGSIGITATMVSNSAAFQNASIGIQTEDARNNSAYNNKGDGILVINLATGNRAEGSGGAGIRGTGSTLTTLNFLRNNSGGNLVSVISNPLGSNLCTTGAVSSTC